jgi:S1-C subfamily serine protease
MSTTALTAFSDQLADAVAAAAPSVVQVRGQRRPASGIVYAPGVVIANMRALGSEDGLRVREHDGAWLDAELAGWDPATGLAVVRAAGLRAAPIVAAAAAPRVGHVVVAVARSWSNAVTASAGIVAIIGGPLPTGRRRSIAEVIRTTAPMHDGFAGGALLDTTGQLLGVATAAAIRGLGVVVPAAIAWTTVASVLEHGNPKRGYLGLAGQQVSLAGSQRTTAGRDRAVLVLGVSDGSPAAAAGVLVGDALIEVDGRPLESPDDLLDVLTAGSVGRVVTLVLLRGGTETKVDVTVGERSIG